MTEPRGPKPPENDIGRLKRSVETHDLVIQGIQVALGELKTGHAALVLIVGAEHVQPNGELHGTGLTGRMVRIEARDRTETTKRSQMLATIRGALIAFGIILPLIVWLTRPSLDRVFHPELTPAHASP